MNRLTLRFTWLLVKAAELLLPSLWNIAKYALFIAGLWLCALLLLLIF